MDIVVMIFITFAPHSVAVLTNPPVQNICRCRFLKTFPPFSVSFPCSVFLTLLT